MQKKYHDLFSLMENESEAKEFFQALPDYLQDAISQRANGVNSFESLCHYAENLTRQDD